MDLSELKKELQEVLDKIFQKEIINDVSQSLLPTPQVKLGIFLTTSSLKIHLLGKEILSLIEENRFFPAIATFRIVFEEIVLLIFVLAKMENKEDWNSAYYLLTKLNIGRKTRDESEKKDELTKPYNVVTAMEIADKYLKKHDPKLSGILENTYDHISDFAHPNAPSRYYFWHLEEDKVKFLYKINVPDQDLCLILHYSCMMIKLYEVMWTKLNSMSLPIDVSYDSLKKITDKVYEKLEKTGKQTPFAKDILRILQQYNINLRTDDGDLHQINISIPKVLKNSIVVGLRYIKHNGSYTEDHFLFQLNKPIEKHYGKSLEKKLKEYIGTHKKQI